MNNNNRINETIKNILKWLINGLNPFHNFWLKVISLITALMALYFVAGQLLVEEMRIPLYITIPDDLASIEPIPDRAMVRILASSTILGSLDKNQLYFNFSDVDFKEGEIYIDIENLIKTPPGVEVVRVIPSKIHLTLEKKIKKTVPISVKFQGKPPRNYEYLKHALHPPDVEIMGASSIINNINEIETEKISLTNRIETFTIDVPLQLENLNIKISKKQTIVLTVYIVKYPKTFNVRNIPIKVISPPKEYKINPQQISATFVCSGEKIDKINPDDIEITINLSDIPGLNMEFRKQVEMQIKNQKLLDYCRFRYFSQKKVDVFVTKIEGNTK